MKQITLDEVKEIALEAKSVADSLESLYTDLFKYPNLKVPRSGPNEKYVMDILKRAKNDLVKVIHKFP